MYKLYIRKECFLNKFNILRNKSLISIFGDELTRKEYLQSEEKVIEFNTLKELFYFVSNYNYFDFKRKVRNRILELFFLNDNDNFGIYFKDEREKYAHESYELVKRIYTVKDENGRTVDIRHYAKEIYNFDRNNYKIDRTESIKRFNEREKIWEDKVKLYEGKDYWRCYRRIQTTKERRYACDNEHKPYIRGKRSFASLPNTYDDLHFHREKTWKARYKVKHQWESKLKKHKDTVLYSKRVYSIDEESVE